MKFLHVSEPGTTYPSSHVPDTVSLNNRVSPAMFELRIDSEAHCFSAKRVNSKAITEEQLVALLVEYEHHCNEQIRQIY